MVWRASSKSPPFRPRCPTARSTKTTNQFFSSALPLGGKGDSVPRETLHRIRYCVARQPESQAYLGTVLPPGLGTLERKPNTARATPTKDDPRLGLGASSF